MKVLLTNFSKLQIILLLFAVSYFAYNPSISAQKVEITPFYGYQFNGKATGYNGDLNIRDASSYGIMLDVNVKNGMQVELLYSRSDTRADFVQYRGPTYKLSDMSVNYFQLGFLRTVKKTKKVEMHGIFSLGASLFSPTGTPYDEIPEDEVTGTYYYEDWWFFSITAGGGAKIWLSKKIGIRLEGRLMMPITWAGGGFMVSSGGGGFYFGGGSAILQASLTAGIIVALGD